MSRSQPGPLSAFVVGLLCLSLVAGAANGSSTIQSTSDGAPSTAGIDQPTTAQLSDSIFEEPSDTVGEPDLEVFLADRTVEPGTETTVELTVLNTGRIERGSRLDDETATARGVDIAVDDDDAPVDVSSGDSGIGSIPPGEAVTVPIMVTAPADAEGDSGELDVEIEYTFTEFTSNDADDETETDSFEVEIEVDDESQFEIDDVETNAQVGTDGTVEVDLENVGSEDADAVRVSARSPTGGVTLGGGTGSMAEGPSVSDETTTGSNGENGQDTEPNEQTGDSTGESVGESTEASASSGAFLGELDSDDTESVQFDTQIDTELSVESYLLELTVVYEDEDGILRESPTLATAVEPTGAQTLEVGAVDSTLAVGDSGTISANIRNTGPSALDSAVVRVEPASDRVDIDETRVAVGDLAVNESTEVTFDAEVSGEAEPGPRQVTFTVEYGIDDERLESDPFVRAVNVSDEQPAFSIRAADAEVPAGTTEPVALTVTNSQAETLSNINVFIFPDDPLNVDADEAFISELEPGESETVTVDVSVDETASQRAYPLEVDFRYDKGGDDDLISQVYQVPITAAEPPEDDGLLPSLVSLAGLAALGIGLLAVVRRYQ